MLGALSSSTGRPNGHIAGSTSSRPRWSGLLSDFTLERRNFVPYTANRFYSIGPFPTDVHIKVLEHVESLAR